jgi:hypothetical protein
MGVMTPVGLARARHEVDMQGSSWETFGKGRQALVRRLVAA